MPAALSLVRAASGHRHPRRLGIQVHDPKVHAFLDEIEPFDARLA
jgi:hypothetical protein